MKGSIGRSLSHLLSGSWGSGGPDITHPPAPRSQSEKQKQELDCVLGIIHAPRRGSGTEERGAYVKSHRARADNGLTEERASRWDTFRSKGPGAHRRA